MPEDCALEVLSPELQLQILLQLEDLDTLWSCIRASPRFYQVFRLNRDIILSAIALKSFHPLVQPEAIAVAKLAQLQHQSEGDEKVRKDTAESFRWDASSNEMYAWNGSDAMGPMSTDLCKLARLFKFFLEDFTQNTFPILAHLGRSEDVEILSDYPPSSHVVHSRLSCDEIQRLQRAFCRFELYRRLFSRCLQDPYAGTHECMKLPLLTTAEQATAC